MFNKTSNKAVFTIIIAFFIVPKVFAQNNLRSGFIISHENDTIRGQIDYRNNSKNYESCIFKDKQGKIEYYPNQIKAFGYDDDKFFSSQIIEGKFVEVLVSGKISLYKSINSYHVKKGASLFKIESTSKLVEVDGKVGTKETNRWRGILSILISDCLENPSEYTSNMKLAEKSLVRLIVKYNNCTGTEYVEFKANKPWTKFDFGVSLGISRNQITSDASGSFSHLDNSYSTIDPSIGILFAISSPRLIEKIAFQGEFHFFKSSFSSLVELGGASTEFHDTFIDLTTISIPVSLKYSFPEKKYGVYFQVGMNYDYHLNSNTRLLSEQVIGNVVNTFPESAAFDVNDNQIGFWGGVGILKTYRKFKASVTIRYFQMSALNRSVGFMANNNRISLNLILLKK